MHINIDEDRKMTILVYLFPDAPGLTIFMDVVDICGDSVSATGGTINAAS